MRQKGLTGFQLKYLAMVLMVLDHLHYFFDYTGKIPLWFTQLGRLAAPLFLFCVVEGFVHTHNRKRYFWRMYSLAVFMGLIQFGFYNLLAGWVRPDGFFPQNRMLSTFAILLVVLQGLAWIEEKRYVRGGLATLLPLLLPCVFAPLYLFVTNREVLFLVNLVNFTILPLHTSIVDGGTATIVIGMALYLWRKSRKGQVLAFVLSTLFFYLLLPVLLTGVVLTPHLLFFEMFEWLSVFAAVFLLAYNGQKGKGSKLFFYLFYPAHIYLLYALSLLFYR